MTSHERIEWEQDVFAGLQELSHESARNAFAAPAPIAKSGFRPERTERMGSQQNLRGFDLKLDVDAHRLA